MAFLSAAPTKSQERLNCIGRIRKIRNKIKTHKTTHQNYIGSHAQALICKTAGQASQKAGVLSLLSFRVILHRSLINPKHKFSI